MLAFSDLHRDLDQAARLVEMSSEADVVIGAGDFASVHEGLAEAIDALAAIEAPAVLVPGNNETDEALREAASRWPAASIPFYGLGAGVPITPWDWSFDLDEPDAERMLSGCPADAVLVVHSPPRGHVDTTGGAHLGSEAILATIEAKRPRIAVCGHVHDCWGQESAVGSTRVLNLGPRGTWIDL
jgi:Icc-related predicted phosphoesterase